MTRCPPSCRGARVGSRGSREAQRALEARAKAEAAAAGAAAPDTATPDPKAHYNVTDPESPIMKEPDGFVQAYNGQIAANELQLIVGEVMPLGVDAF